MTRRRQSNRPTNCELLFSWLVCLLFLFLSCRTSWERLENCGFFYPSYQSWEISEWLINYQGGFVRRGLAGQVLWMLEQWHPFDVRVAITLFCIISTIVVLWVIVRIFNRRGWALLIIPTGFCLGFTMFSTWARRDFLSLMLAYAIFVLFRHVARNPGKRTGWIAFYIVSATQLLIHEASFFYTFPILVLLDYHNSRRNQPIARRAIPTLLRFLPVLLVMALVCLFKGNEAIAQTVWASWEPIISRYQPDATTIGNGVGALGWDTGAIIPYHLVTSLVGHAHPSAWRIPLVLFNLLAGYFLLTRLDSVNMGLYRTRPMDHAFMSDVAVIQFIALLPMFTVLSCDWGRTLPYWVITSFLLYHTFKDEPVAFPAMLSRMSIGVQRFITGNRLLRSPHFYILIALLAPVPYYFAPLDHINTMQQRAWFLLTDAFHTILTTIS